MTITKNSINAVLLAVSISALPPCPESDLHDTIRQMEALTGQETIPNDVAGRPCNPCGTYSATVMPEDRFTVERKILTSLVERDDSLGMRPIAMWSSTSPDKVALLFTGSHRDWRYLQCGESSVNIH